MSLELRAPHNERLSLELPVEAARLGTPFNGSLCAEDGRLFSIDRNIVQLVENKNRIVRVPLPPSQQPGPSNNAGLQKIRGQPVKPQASTPRIQKGRAAPSQQKEKHQSADQGDHPGRHRRPHPAGTGRTGRPGRHRRRNSGSGHRSPGPPFFILTDESRNQP